MVYSHWFEAFAPFPFQSKRKGRNTVLPWNWQEYTIMVLPQRCASVLTFRPSVGLRDLHFLDILQSITQMPCSGNIVLIRPDDHEVASTLKALGSPWYGTRCVLSSRARDPLTRSLATPPGRCWPDGAFKQSTKTAQPRNGLWGTEAASLFRRKDNFAGRFMLQSFLRLIRPRSDLT